MKNSKFIAAYKRLPRVNKQFIKVRDQIIKETNVSQATFYNWYQGLTYIPEHHHETIANIMNIEVTELFPHHEYHV